jgi:hypothetical protein
MSELSSSVRRLKRLSSHFLRRIWRHTSSVRVPTSRHCTDGVQVTEIQAHAIAAETPTQIETKRVPAEIYNRRSYRLAIVRSIDKATQERVFGLLKPLAEFGSLVLPDGMHWKSLCRRRTLLTKISLRAIGAANVLGAEIDRLRIPYWSPLRLRHTAATLLRAKYGVEAAKVILGHAKVETTQIYAERDLNNAERILKEIG